MPYLDCILRSGAYQNAYSRDNLRMSTCCTCLMCCKAHVSVLTNANESHHRIQHEYALRKLQTFRIYRSAVNMPPCLYICCHCEISDDHHGSPARPKASSKAIQDGRRTSRRHTTNRGKHSPRERQRESPRADRQRHHSRRRSRSSSVRLPSKALTTISSY